MFSKSASLLDLPHKSTIRAIFRAKSVDPKTNSPPSSNMANADGRKCSSEQLSAGHAGHVVKVVAAVMDYALWLSVLE